MGKGEGEQREGAKEGGRCEWEWYSRGMKYGRAGEQGKVPESGTGKGTRVGSGRRVARAGAPAKATLQEMESKDASEENDFLYRGAYQQ